MSFGKIAARQRFYVDPVWIASVSSEERKYLEKIGNDHKIFPGGFVQDNSGRIREIPAKWNARTTNAENEAIRRKKRAREELPKLRRAHKKRLVGECCRLSKMAGGLIVALEKKLGWEEWGYSDVKTKMTPKEKSLITKREATVLALRSKLDNLDTEDELAGFVKKLQKYHSVMDEISGRIWVVKKKTYGHTEYSVQPDEEDDFDTLYAQAFKDRARK